MSDNDSDIINQLTAIAQNLATPSTYIQFINNNYTNLVGTVNNLVTQFESWQASFEASGLLTGATLTMPTVQLWVTSQLATLTTTIQGWVNNQITLIPKRIILTAATTFYVSNVAGNSDVTGDGTAAKPWSTLQHAYTTLLKSYDVNVFQVTIQIVGAGTYPGFNAIMPLVGQSSVVVIQGNALLPSSIIINAVTTHCVYATNGAYLQVNNLLFESIGLIANLNGLCAAYYSTIVMGPGITFGSFNSSSAPTAGGAVAIVATRSGQIIITKSYTITGNCYAHLLASFAGVIDYSFNSAEIVVGINNNPWFSNAFALAVDGGIILVQNRYTYGTQFWGAATGYQYAIYNGGMIDTQGTSINNQSPSVASWNYGLDGYGYIPGSVAGQISSGVNQGFYS